MELAENYIKIDSCNVSDEHICCAIGDKKHLDGVAAKKELMQENFTNGYEFIRLDARGKIFIDFMPTETAFAPIIADNYYYIQCFWVSGSYVKKGHGSALIEMCKAAAIENGKDGIVIVSSDKKRPFLADKKFLTKMGFTKCDSAPPYFELLEYKINTKADSPKFTELSKEPKVPSRGVVHFYSNWCPFNKYYSEILKDLCTLHGIVYTDFPIETAEDAKAAPTPFTINTLFYDGQFLTHEILSEKSFEKKILTLI